MYLCTIKNRTFYKMRAKQVIVAVAAMVFAAAAQGQGILGGNVTGNVQMDAQMSRADSTIGATDVPEKLLMNARADILYTNGDFSAGLRFEAYQNPLLGFDAQWQGQGLAHYFVGYNSKLLSVTVGHFYEQFGSGLILRTYEDRYLGLDNALFGINVALRPVEGVTIKALAGKQRYYWELGDGLVRGVDAEANIVQLVPSLRESKLRAIVGAGFVSKYEDEEIIGSATPGYRLKLPLNSGAASVRGELGWGGWSLQGEYARKGQDPTVMNGFTYKEGQVGTQGGEHVVQVDAHRCGPAAVHKLPAGHHAAAHVCLHDHIPLRHQRHGRAGAAGRRDVEGEERDVAWRQIRNGHTR